VDSVKQTLTVSSPGRLCLFGEHQDYLGLPVISMAISLRARIHGAKRLIREVIIHKPDINETESFFLDDLSYSKPRDYFKSGINVCRGEGLIFSNGFECEVTSEIPFQSGTSSSSAIMVSWIHYLSKMADEPVDWNRQKLGELAFKAEVKEFNEPGGMMDQYSSAIGNLIYLESEPEISINLLNPKLGTFVLGDSCETKDTMGMLQRCRDLRLNIINNMKSRNSSFDLHSCDLDSISSSLNDEELNLMKGTVQNRNLLKQSLSELEKDEPNHELIGNLLTEHHLVLRDVLGVSTPKIESMLNASLQAGALGGKINGSGGGGCMFSYAPDHPEKVAEAIVKVGGKAYVVHIDDGTIID